MQTFTIHNKHDSTFCPLTALTDEGQPQTAESTPTDNPLSNGVPVSNILISDNAFFDEYLKPAFTLFIENDIPPMYGLGV